MASFATIRLVATIVGASNLFLFILVFAIPYWRKTEVSASSEALANIWGHEGLWIECFSLYNKAAQCGQIGTTNSIGTATSRTDSTYYMFGIYAYLGAYRTLMVVAFVTGIAAVALSGAGMRCNSFFEEGGSVKHWMNVASGICHFVTGILTCVACSWYAALVMKEQTSPFYQTTRLKYTIGACIYMGWITSAISIALGCVLTCCTCFNRPAAENEYYYDSKPPISEIEIPTKVAEKETMISEITHQDRDEWDRSESRYAPSKKSHRSHRSGRSSRGRTEKKSRRDDDYDYDDRRDRYRYDDRDRYYDDEYRDDYDDRRRSDKRSRDNGFV